MTVLIFARISKSWHLDDPTLRTFVSYMNLHHASLNETLWILISYSYFPLSANPYENTTEEAASEFSNREIPVNPEVDLNLQTSK